jgi:NADPH:quinone reductase-like Zn-dependent oxidoreductase
MRVPQRWPPQDRPAVRPGQEIAGVVEAVGEGAGVQPVERVYARLFPTGGGFVEVAPASAERLAPMPGLASFEEAAGLVIGGGTAHEGLVDRKRLAPTLGRWAAPAQSDAGSHVDP